MSADVQTGVLLDMDKLRKLSEALADKQVPTGYDVETGYSGPDRPKGSLDHDWELQFTCGFSLSIGTDRARYVPLRHDGGGNVDDPEKAWWAIKPLLTRGVIVAHNARYEMRSVVKAAGYQLCSNGGTLRDTMLDAYVLSKYRLPDQYRAVHGLKELVEVVLGHRMTHFDELFDDKPTERYKTAQRFNVLDATDPKVIQYACEDAAWCLALENKIGPMAEAERPAMRRVEHMISVIMADVERHGVAVDWDAIGRAAAQFDQFKPAMEAGVKAGLSTLVGGRDLTDLNLNSSPQLKALLYRDAGLRTTRLTKGADKKVDVEEWEKMSTDAIAMEGLSRKHPPIRQLLEIREVNNLGGRLAKWLKEYHFAADGRVHANYSQTTVGSGRFAAGDPAIQQLPKQWRWAADPEVDPWAKPDTPEGERWAALVADAAANGGSYWAGSFRDFLVAAPGHYLLTFDYSQIELRVLAGESQEPALLEAFNTGVDVHTATAAMMLGIPVDQVDEVDRAKGKTLNFALLYGMGIKSLAERLALSVEEAKQLYEQYFARLTRVASWVDKARSRGLSRGYCETRFGRKYTVWELRSDQPGIRAKGERVLVNAPIQGGAADYMKLSMIRAHKALTAKGWWMNGCTIVMNQHDSLTFEVSDDLDPNEVRALLAAAVVFDVPANPHTGAGAFPKIVADWELGQRWGSSAKWKDGHVAVRTADGGWTLKGPDVPDPTPDGGEPVPDGLQDSQSDAQGVEQAVDSPPFGSMAELEAERLATVHALPARTYSQEVPTPPLLVRAEREPNEDQFDRLMRLLDRHPGDRQTLLIVPAGQVPLGLTGLGPEHAGELSAVLGGATVEDQVRLADVRVMGAGIVL